MLNLVFVHKNSIERLRSSLHYLTKNSPTTTKRWNQKG